MFANQIKCSLMLSWSFWSTPQKGVDRRKQSDWENWYVEKKCEDISDHNYQSGSGWDSLKGLDMCNYTWSNNCSSSAAALESSLNWETWNRSGPPALADEEDPRGTTFKKWAWMVASNVEMIFKATLCNTTTPECHEKVHVSAPGVRHRKVHLSEKCGIKSLARPPQLICTVFSNFTNIILKPESKKIK